MWANTPAPFQAWLRHGSGAAVHGCYSGTMLHTRESVLERVNDEYNALEAAIAKLSKADWEFALGKPEGKDHWRVKDSLAHITYWKARSMRRFRGERRKPGEAPQPRSLIDANHIVFEEWKDRPVEDVLAWHRQVQSDLVAAVLNAPESHFSKRERSPSWPFGAVGHSTKHRMKDLERLPAKASR